ncbi:hypothetical protein LY78DRAFT_23453 [Colletotrichum sublineola]|nr:hypothetical protein LY78DRAFT_23453 [Colletotrichum sublineola]
MASEARARANVPRRVVKQTTNGMDSYHRFVVESTTPSPAPTPTPTPPPQTTQVDSAARPYHGHSRSFSTPRPWAAGPSSSASYSDTESSGQPQVPEITVTSPGRPQTVAPRYSLTPRQTAFPPKIAASAVRPPPPIQQLPPLPMPAQRANHRPQPSQSSIPPPATASTDDSRKRDGLIDVALPYRPFYLQRRVLISFAVLFAGLLVAVEAVLDLSNKRGGLGSPDHGFRYLWQYGSAFIFTCIAALWARPEHQARSSAPWLRMAKGPASVDRTLMLDYVFMFEPLAVVKAAKNRDWLVAVTATIGLTLKLIVVIAVALVSPTFQIVTARGANLTLRNKFVNDPAGLQDAGTLPFYTMAALQTRGLNFPDGTSKQFAFQLFTADVPTTAELQTNVDGFGSDIECEPAQLNLTGIQFTQGIDVQLNVTVSTPSCLMTQTIPNMALVGSALPSFFMAFQPGFCGASPSPSPNDGRVVVMTGAIAINQSSVPSQGGVLNVPISGNVTKSAALICRPSYFLTRVHVTKNNTQLISIERNRSANNKTLDKVHPWDIVQGHFNSYPTDSQILGVIPNVSSRYPRVANVASDPVMNAAVAMEVKDHGVPPIETFLNANNLTAISTAYWRQYTALVGRNSLMGETQEKSTGTAVIIGERLNVRPIPAHLLSGLLGFVFVLVLAAIAFAPAKGFLPRNPNSIINMATLLAHSRQLLQCLRGTGAANISSIRERLLGTDYFTGVEPYEKAEKSAQGYFKIFGGAPPSQNAPPEFVRNAEWRHPLPLHPGARLAAVVIMFGMIISLEVVLGVSNTNSGIATIKANTDRHFLWTTGTGVIFGLVVLYLATADCATRCLAPYAKLKEGGSFETTVDLDFMDKSKFRILYDAARTKNIAVVITTAALLVSSLLATFSGALYSTTPIPSTRPVTLQITDSFTNTSTPCPTCTTDTLLASLILDANLTFPSFTFEDLNFNSLRLTEQLNMQDGAGAIIVTLPAIRSRLDCRLYPQSEINTNFTLTTMPNQSLEEEMKIRITGEPCLDPSIRSDAISPSNGSASSVFGVATPRSAASTQCSDFTYVWGQLNENTPGQVGYISAMGCNETLVSVMAKVRLTGESLHVDPTYPPVVQENTARPVNLSLLPLQYGLLANFPTGNQLDPFFSSLVSSRFAVPAANLGDPGLGKSGLVADAIVRQHGILRAQNLNVNSRRRLPDISAQATIPAMLESTSVTSLRRLVQDKASTRIIQSVLALLIALTLVAWLLTPGTDRILPRNPCSIASVAALLVDGNVFGFLGRGAEWQATKEMKRSFLDGSHSMGFRIGYERARKRRGIEDLNGVKDDGNVAYGINVKRGGGWGGGEDVGLGILARVNRAQRQFVRGWGKM